MGSASSITSQINFKDERQLKLFEELQIEYELNKNNNNMSEEENFRYYKKKYEEILLLQSDNKDNNNKIEYHLGDIISIKETNSEGIIIDKTESGYKIDIGNNGIIELTTDKFSLILSGLEYEIGDKVQVKPIGSNNYYIGHIININYINNINNNLISYDIQMLGDINDIEKNVLPNNLRKILSHRLIKKKLKKLINTVHAAAAFNYNKSNNSNNNVNNDHKLTNINNDIKFHYNKEFNDNDDYKEYYTNNDNFKLNESKCSDSK